MTAFALFTGKEMEIRLNYQISFLSEMKFQSVLFTFFT